MAFRAEGRKANPNGRRAFNLKFRFNGCWHCAEAGHSRKANEAKGIKGCSKFEALKARNGGKPPAGYKGAYEKARDAAWEKFKKSQPKMNMLESDYEDDSDLEYQDDDLPSDGVFALTSNQHPNFEHANSFGELSSDDEESDMDESFINDFAGWAHSVKVAPSQRSSNKTVRINSLKDLDEKMPKDSRLTALPTNTKKLQRALKKLESANIQVADDEVLALVDTGSSIHAADCETHFADYVPHVRRTPGQKNALAATTAGGHRLDNLGRFVVSAIADGQQVHVQFNHMKVKLPILSARQMLHKGGSLTLTESGGSIINERVGQKINFMIHEGLWYMKLKVNKPPNTGFGRQGARSLILGLTCCTQPL